MTPSYLVVSLSYFSIGRPRVKKHKEVLPGNQRGHDRDRADTRLKAGERRERFFADDDVSLDELVARERKEGRQAKYDAHYADNISRNKQCVHLIHRHCNCMLRLLAACSLTGEVDVVTSSGSRRATIPTTSTEMAALPTPSTRSGAHGRQARITSESSNVPLPRQSE
jgi:hypothetical protein